MLILSLQHSHGEVTLFLFLVHGSGYGLTGDSAGIRVLVPNKSSWDADTGEAWMSIQGTTYLSGLDFSEDERAGRGSVADLFTTFSPSM